MINQLLEIVREIHDRSDELFPLYAVMYKKAFDELVSVGFSEEQALSILVNLKITG